MRSNTGGARTGGGRGEAILEEGRVHAPSADESAAEEGGRGGGEEE